MSSRTFSFRRLLAAPGQEAALRDAVVTVEDGRIRSIRPDVAPAGRAAPEDLLVLPAMVNAHDHGYGLRPLALGGVDDALECWIASLTAVPRSIPGSKRPSPSAGWHIRVSARPCIATHSLAADRLAAEAAGVAQAAADVGIRVAFSCPILDRNAFAYGDQGALLPHLDPVDQTLLTAAMSRTGPAEHLVDQVEAIAAAFESERFQVQYGPIGPQWCQDSTLERIARASADHGRRVHMHLLESPRQREWLDFAYPQGILHHLDAIGLLSPRLAVAHGVQLTAPECELLAERGVTVAVNTSSQPAAPLRGRSDLPLPQPRPAFRVRTRRRSPRR